MPWTLLPEGAKPNSRAEMLVTVRTDYNRYFTVLAKYIHRFTEPNTNEYDDGDYSESDDEYYTPEGWYEIALCNPEFSHWPVEGIVVAVQPAPTPWKPAP